MQAERRTEPRCRPPADSGAIATLGLVPRAAYVCDVSPSGLNLRTTIPAPLGAIVPVWLPGPPGGSSILVLATVVDVSPAEQGLHRVGLSCCPESQDLLGEFVRRLPALGWTSSEEPARPATAPSPAALSPRSAADSGQSTPPPPTR